MGCTGRAGVVAVAGPKARVILVRFPRRRRPRPGPRGARPSRTGTSTRAPKIVASVQSVCTVASLHGTELGAAHDAWGAPCRSAAGATSEAQGTSIGGVRRLRTARAGLALPVVLPSSTGAAGAGLDPARPPLAAGANRLLMGGAAGLCAGAGAPATVNTTRMRWGKAVSRNGLPPRRQTSA